MTIDFAKLVEGVELVDVETESLRMQESDLSKKVSALGESLANATSALEATREALESRAALPTPEEQAKTLAETMDSLGVKPEAIRAAIVTQFGKKSVAPVLPLRPPSAGGTKEKKITAGLPDAAVADAILTAIRETGAEGIRMETLYEKFPTAGADSDKSRVAVFATVKNAVLDKTVGVLGQARGTRYFWAPASV